MQSGFDWLNLHSALQLALKLGWVVSSNNVHRCALHELVPGVIFSIDSIDKGDRISYRSYLDDLQAENIQTIIRFGRLRFADQTAEELGFKCVSCEYSDDIPAPGVVSSFFYTLRTSVLRKVVILSDGRKGRAATLCALHLMHTYDFSAGEATMWLRLTCPNIRLRDSQEQFLYAVGSAVQDQEIVSWGRDVAFRRAVHRVWAKDLRRDCCDSRPHSPYEVANSEGQAKGLDAHRPARHCGAFAWDQARLALERSGVRRVRRRLLPADCCAERPSGREEAGSAAEARAVPSQLRMR